MRGTFEPRELFLGYLDIFRRRRFFRLWLLRLFGLSFCLRFRLDLNLGLSLSLLGRLLLFRASVEVGLRLFLLGAQFLDRRFFVVRQHHVILCQWGVIVTADGKESAGTGGGGWKATQIDTISASADTPATSAVVVPIRSR